MTAENYNWSVQVMSRESSVSSKDHVRQKKHNGLIDLWAVCFRAVLYRTGWKPPLLLQKGKVSSCGCQCAPNLVGDAGVWRYILTLHEVFPSIPPQLEAKKPQDSPMYFDDLLSDRLGLFQQRHHNASRSFAILIIWHHQLVVTNRIQEQDSMKWTWETLQIYLMTLTHDSHVGLMMTQNDLERSDKFPSTHNYPVKRYYQYRILTASQSFSNSQFDSSASTSFQSVSSLAFLLPRPARQNDASLKAPAITGSCPFKPTCFKLLWAHGKQCWYVKIWFKKNIAKQIEIRKHHPEASPAFSAFFVIFTSSTQSIQTKRHIGMWKIAKTLKLTQQQVEPCPNSWEPLQHPILLAIWQQSSLKRTYATICYTSPDIKVLNKHIAMNISTNRQIVPRSPWTWCYLQ